ncbi:transcriptional regulator [Actinomadura flavalba]|uniref:transcriptional regulator n=1 Tax=Actinomadura flavalba TaxID=1120938 RepID=UPI0003650917|nr:transcriptional regulator [Actinomadura flavalba]
MDERRADVLAELRGRLADGLAGTRLTKTQLATRAGLGRTTVQQAFQADSPEPPSAQTVAALAKVLRLPADELLELRRAALAEPAPDAPGRPIGAWHPHDLEVHPAGAVTEALPSYVARAHDAVLAEAVRDVASGRSRMLVLVGTSSTGKTRACWEAVQPLADRGWRLWHPFDPTRAEAALDELHRVAPHTVVWLNEAQHYLGDPATGERVAAALHTLLTDADRAPVLILGTLWPEYADRYTAPPRPDAADPYSRVRELLAARTVTVPDTFGPDELRAARASGDDLLSDALSRAAEHGRVTQDLAGAPELLRRYEQPASPAVRALLDAAMDARRLGVGLHLPRAFLVDAVPDYLSDDDLAALPADWADTAFADLARPVHGRQTPLQRVVARPASRPSAAAPVPQDGHRLADYLEQHGRVTRWQVCPPASFWHAALTRLPRAADVAALAEAAADRHRLQWAHALRMHAAEAGHPGSLRRLAEAREESGDPEGAAALLRRAAESGDARALLSLADERTRVGDWSGAEPFARRAARAGAPDGLTLLAEISAASGDRERAEDLARLAAEHGEPYAYASLSRLYELRGERDVAERLARLAVRAGEPGAIARLAERRAELGDRAGAEDLARRAAEAGDGGDALAWLVHAREESDGREEAEALARRTADLAPRRMLFAWAALRERADDHAGAAALYRRAAGHDHPEAMARVAVLCEESGERAEAERWARRSAGPDALSRLAALREAAGDRAGAEALWRECAELSDAEAVVRLAVLGERSGDRAAAERWASGHTGALSRLAELREAAGDRAGAEALWRECAELGDTDALIRLVGLREQAGDRVGAETLVRQAAQNGHVTVLLAQVWEQVRGPAAEPLYRSLIDAGHADSLAGIVERAGERTLLHAWWPHGLDPDGALTPPWSPEIQWTAQGDPA